MAAVSLFWDTEDFGLTWGVCDGTSVHLIFPFKYRFRAVHKEIYKKCHNVCFSIVSFRGQFNLVEPHTLVSLKGLILIFQQASLSFSY